MAPSRPRTDELLSSMTGAPDCVVLKFADIVLLFVGFGWLGAGGCRAAVVAEALVEDLCDLNGHAVRAGRPLGSQAGGVSHGAVHVLDPAATGADGVVVVVAHTG